MLNTDLAAHLRNRASDLFTPAYYQAYQAASQATASLLCGVLDQLGAQAILATGATPARLAEILGVPPDLQVLPDWAMRFLSEQGWVRPGGDGDLSIPPGPAPVLTDAVRTLVDDGLPLLRHAAAVWPKVLSGEVDGMRALLRGEGMALWERYFHPDHSLYDVHNQWGGAAVATLLPPGGSVLELGAGFGSAAVANINALTRAGRMPREYLVTDANLLLARRTGQLLSEQVPSVSVRSFAFDFTREPGAQGIERGSVDLIYACNALHCAVNLPVTLAYLRQCLRPGGYLVLSECARATPRSTLHQEFIFLLLGSYRNVPLDANRQSAGFLPPDSWRSLLAAAGFQEIVVVSNQRNGVEPVLGAVIAGVAP